MRYSLITGGLGFIGAHIARRLLADRICDRVVLLDHYGEYISPMKRLSVDYRKLRIAEIEEQVIIERGQAHYPSVTSQLLRQYRPEYIFHLAALPLASLQNANTQEAAEGSVSVDVVPIGAMRRLEANRGLQPQEIRLLLVEHGVRRF